MRAPALIHEAVGRPDPRRGTHPASGRCYWCAAAIVDRACKVSDVITDSFTDQDQALARSSPWLCVACSWAMTGRPPDTLRLWSIAWREVGPAWPAHHPACTLPTGAVHAQNKADPSAFRELLRDPPACRWVCSIADSGQIHTLPFTPVNNGPGGYGVRFERVTIRTSAEVYSRLDDSIAALMAAGFSKQDIAGEPYPGRLAARGIDLWRAHQRVLSPWRGSDLLDLALFLARKEVADGSGAATEVRDRTGAHDDVVGVERSHPTHRVVEPRKDGARDRGAPSGQLRLDGRGDGAQAPDRRDHDRDRGANRRTVRKRRAS